MWRGFNSDSVLPKLFSGDLAFRKTSANILFLHFARAEEWLGGIRAGFFFESATLYVVVRVDRFPITGETITGHSCDLMPGGKGVNQAVAVANMGVPVDLIGALGDDEFGKLLRSHLIDAGVNIGAVVQTKSSSGTAIVTVDDEGKNQIIVIPGSNLLLQQKMIERYFERQGSVVRYLVSQFEVPLDLICYAFGKMKGWGTTILNPSPMRSIPDKLIEYTDIFVLNELELAQAVGIAETISSPDEVAQAAFEWARRIGSKIVVVTLGKNGLIAIQDGQVIKQPAQVDPLSRSCTRVIRFTKVWLSPKKRRHTASKERAQVRRFRNWNH
jgi:ribokinase